MNILEWSPLISFRPVSMIALRAGMPPRDLEREGELTRRTREMLAAMELARNMASNSRWDRSNGR